MCVKVRNSRLTNEFIEREIICERRRNKDKRKKTANRKEEERNTEKE